MKTEGFRNLGLSFCPPCTAGLAAHPQARIAQALIKSTPAPSSHLEEKPEPIGASEQRYPQLLGNGAARQGGEIRHNLGVD